MTNSNNGNSCPPYPFRTPEVVSASTMTGANSKNDNAMGSDSALPLVTGPIDEAIIVRDGGYAPYHGGAVFPELAPYRIFETFEDDCAPNESDQWASDPRFADRKFPDYDHGLVGIEDQPIAAARPDLRVVDAETFNAVAIMRQERGDV